jgi:hypothetical protein
MAVTAYSVFYDYDFGPNYLRNVAIMNIGSVDPNWEAEHWQAWKCTTYYWIRKHLVHTSGNFITNKETNQSSRTTFWSFTYKNFDALDKSSTQFDLGTNFFWTGNTPNHSTIFSKTCLHYSI